MGQGLTLVTGPPVEPVTLIEARTQLRLDSTNEDPHVERLIKAAREWCEAYTGRAFVQQTWRLTLDRFPPVIRLPKPELRSVTSILYDDGNGAEQTLATDQYVVDAGGWVGRITPAYGTTWPATYPQMGAVRVTYVAGYADDGASPLTDASYRANVPEGVKQGILLVVSELFKHRELTTKPEWNSTVPMGVETVLGFYRHVVMD